MATPQSPVPPQMMHAEQSLAQAIAQVEKRPIDLLATSWADIEKSVIKLLGGAFEVQNPDHQAVALGIAAVFGSKLAKELGAFWFPQRDALEGAALGLPEALVTLSPFNAALDALSQAKLEQLEGLTTELRKSLAASKFSLGSAGAPRLRADDYVRLFDPGFIQLAALDPAKAKQVWAGTAPAAAREIRDALSRVQKLPAEAKQQVDAQICGALARMDPAKPLSSMPEAGSMADLLGHLFATKAATGIAPEEFWRELAVQLALIGAPAQFPPLEDEDVQAYAAGAPLIALYVDVVPNQTRPTDEDGLLGIFPAADMELSDVAVARGAPPRLLKVKPEALRAALKGFDLAKAKQSLIRFGDELEKKAGKKVPQAPEAEQMADAAWALIEDTGRLLQAVDQGAELYIRRLTEAEAASEPALSLVRDALQGPRIIL